MNRKPREWWLAIPPKGYDGGPGAWQSKNTAERSYFPEFGVKRVAGNRFRIFPPSEIVHVREVISTRNKITKTGRSS